MNNYKPAHIESEDIVRVLRVIEYEGPRSLVEDQILRSMHGTRYGAHNESGRVKITAVTLTEFPTVLEQAKQLPDKKGDFERDHPL